MVLFCLLNRVSILDQGDSAGSERFRQWAGADECWPLHPRQRTCRRKEIQQENRAKGVQPGLSEPR